MPSMITSTKNHTHPQKNKRTDVTLRQMVTAKLYRQNHKEAYTYTLTKREKGKNYIYLYTKKESNQINKQI